MRKVGMLYSSSVSSLMYDWCMDGCVHRWMCGGGMRKKRPPVHPYSPSLHETEGRLTKYIRRLVEKRHHNAATGFGVTRRRIALIGRDRFGISHPIPYIAHTQQNAPRPESRRALYAVGDVSLCAPEPMRRMLIRFYTITQPGQFQLATYSVTSSVLLFLLRESVVPCPYVHCTAY